MSSAPRPDPLTAMRRALTAPDPQTGRPLGLTTRALLTQYVAHMNASGEAYPGTARLAALVGCDPKTVQIARRALVRCGYLELIKRASYRSSPTYRVLTENLPKWEQALPTRD